jgi:hypothetical protein
MRAPTTFYAYPRSNLLPSTSQADPIPQLAPAGAPQSGQPQLARGLQAMIERIPTLAPEDLANRYGQSKRKIDVCQAMVPRVQANPKSLVAHRQAQKLQMDMEAHRHLMHEIEGQINKRRDAGTWPLGHVSSGYNVGGPPPQFLPNGTTNPEWLRNNQMPPDLYTNPSYPPLSAVQAQAQQAQVAAHQQQMLASLTPQEQAELFREMQPAPPLLEPNFTPVWTNFARTNGVVPDESLLNLDTKHIKLSDLHRVVMSMGGYDKVRARDVSAVAGAGANGGRIRSRRASCGRSSAASSAGARSRAPTAARRPGSAPRSGSSMRTSTT